MPIMSMLPHSNILKKSFNVVNRVRHTAGVAGLSVLRVAKGEKPDAILLRETFEQLGTTYIKIGQFIASTPSLFPREYVLAFQGCLDQTTPLPFQYIEQVLTEELLGDNLSDNSQDRSQDKLGKRSGNNETNGGLNSKSTTSKSITSKPKTLEDLFLEIYKKPLASASIAQVHAAKLRDGTQVVLKVQKPDVGTIMQTDLGVLYAVSKIIERLMPKMKFASISPLIDEIRIRMLAETDFIAEAANIREFQQFLQVTGNRKVVAPEVVDALTTKRVLTMSRLHGMSMVDEVAMRQYCADPAQVMADTLNTWFASLMLCNSFHADLHAGNLMLLEDGRIGFIDFGIVGKIAPESWQACMGMMQALQSNDYASMASCMIDMGMTHERSQVNEAELALDLEKMITSIMAEDKAFTSGKPIQTKNQADELNKMMLDMVEVGRKHGIHFPRDFALLTKQMLYFDRFMRTLAPDMDMFTDARVSLLGKG